MFLEKELKIHWNVAKFICQEQSLPIIKKPLSHYFGQNKPGSLDEKNSDNAEMYSSLLLKVSPLRINENVNFLNPGNYHMTVEPPNNSIYWVPYFSAHFFYSKLFSSSASSCFVLLQWNHILQEWSFKNIDFNVASLVESSWFFLSLCWIKKVKLNIEWSSV